MNVLVACEFSGIVRNAFIARGHNATSCDLLPTESDKTATLSGTQPQQYKPHYQGNVLDLLNKPWDLMIAHPPCTYLTNAGVRWVYKGGKGKIIDPKRRGEMLKAAVFFNALLEAPIPRIAVENPIMHCFAKALIRSHDQIVQPWQFGHTETKATCLWLKGLPPLKPTKVIAPDYEKYPPGRGNGYEPKVHYTSPGPERGHERSRTLQGLADAMAEQWGSL